MSTASLPSLQDIRALGKQTAVSAGGTNVEAYFSANKHAIAAVLPKHMTAERMVKIALRCLRTTPKLLKCELATFMGAVITCSQLGLEPNTPQGHIYIIPFENKRKKTFEAQVIIGYKGLLDLSRRTGEIVSISSRPVYVRDDLDIEYGCDERCRVKPYLDGDAGAVRGFLAVAKLKDGGTQFEYMSVRQVEEIRDGSEGYKSAKRFNSLDKSPWTTNFIEMGRKTVIRRICKYLPMSVELANLLAREDAADAGNSQGLDNVINLSPDELAEVETDADNDNDAPQSETTQSETSNAPAAIGHEEAVIIPQVDVMVDPKPDPLPANDERVILPGRPDSMRATRSVPAPAPDSAPEPEDDGFGTVE